MNRTLCYAFLFTVSLTSITAIAVEAVPTSTPAQAITERIGSNTFGMRASAPGQTGNGSQVDNPERIPQISNWLRKALSGSTLRTIGHGAKRGGNHKQAEALEGFVSIEATANNNVELRMRDGTGTPREMRGKLLQPGEQGPWGEGERDKRTAKAFLRTHRHLLKLRDPDNEMRFARAQRDQLGHRHLRFEQTYRGLPVWGNGLIVQLDEAGNAISMAGGYVPTPSRRFIIHPVLDVATAISKARIAVEAADAAEVKAPVLVVHAAMKGMPRLAWMVEVNAAPDSVWRVMVDAANGSILAKHSLVMEAAASGSGIDLFGNLRSLNIWNESGQYYLVDTSKPMYDPISMDGSIIVLDSQNVLYPSSYIYVTSNNPVSWPLADGVSAAYNLSQTYDYFRLRHNRNSLDGEGGSIRGVIRVPMDNAHWNSADQTMSFGNWRHFAGASDVVAHELTHGVIEKSAALVYQYQSGALNEAMSDIFGEMVEARIKGTSPDWLKGGQLFNGGILNFINPNAVSCGVATCPAHMSQYINTAEDYGGVHLNSSIINHAYYLLAEGLPGSIGIANAERIFYRLLTTKLFPYSEFSDARVGAIAAASELFGAGSVQAAKVAEAFDTVGIYGTATTRPPQYPVVVGEDNAVFVYDYDGAYYLARRETDLGDGIAGYTLSAFDVSPTRPSVSGDGSFTVFVDSANDLCLISTDGSTSESCLGFPGQISSVAISRDQTKVAVVLLDAFGNPDNNISILDLETEQATTHTLRAPLLDGGSVDVLNADILEFTGDGRGLVYDAYNVLALQDGTQIGLWSIYRLDVVTGAVVTVVPPIPGLDIGFPSLGKTSDNLITFEAVESATGQSTVVIADLFRRELASIDVPAFSGFAAPVFTGDDLAVVYTTPDTSAFTGSSCERQSLASDHVTPVGTPTLWTYDGAYCAAYRRGTYTPPQNFTLSITRAGTGSGLVTSVPSGIVCGTDCSGSFLKDSVVTLTPTANSGSVFAGWSGSSDCIDGVVTLLANRTCTATFNIPPVVTVTASDNTATEASLTTGTYTFTRTGSMAAALAVTYSVGGTATSGSDYIALGTQITFPIGARRVTKNLKPIQDTLQELNETVVLRLRQSASYMVGTPTTATITLTSNDTITRTVSVAATDRIATEAGLTTGIYTFSRTGSTAAALTVYYSVGGSATSSSDYIALGTRTTFPIGASRITKTLKPIQDRLQEPNETAVLRLRQSPNYAVGRAGSATITLTSND